MSRTPFGGRIASQCFCSAIADLFIFATGLLPATIRAAFG
jgi:hypothetical protein